jgi:ssDNA-binding Zn-finger/Zn-ribbon topoisomerase 1
MVKKRDGPKEKENKMEMKCPHCGSKMRFRGAGDTAGSRFWKCRNKKCGRTVWKKADPPKEVIPVVYEKKV